MIEKDKISGNVYTSHQAHLSVSSGDGLDFYDYYDGNGEYFLGEGVIFYIRDDAVLEPDPLLKSKLFDILTNCEVRDTKEIELLFSSFREETFYLREVESIDYSNQLYHSEDIFEGELFQIHQTYDYNYDTNSGRMEDGYIVDGIKEMNTSIIKEDDLDEMNIKEAIRIGKIKRKQ
jgi:hypothetical protein